MSVVINDGDIEATAFFSESLLEANQIFGLVVEKYCGAASIRFTPLDATVRTPQSGGGVRPGLEVNEWDLLEWSIVGIPDNPEAVRKLLDKNKLAGSVICESIAKCLTPYAAPVKKLGRGLNLGGKTVAKKAAAKTTKAEDENPEDETPVDEVPADEVPADETEETPEEEKGEMPLGAQVASATLTAMAQLADTIAMSIRPMEHPEMKGTLGEMADTLRGHCAELQAAYDKNYPDHKLAEPNAADPDKSAVQKFLAGNKSKCTQVTGMAFALNSMSRDASIPKACRDSLARIGSSINAVVKAAKETPARPRTRRRTRIYSRD